MRNITEEDDARAAVVSVTVVLSGILLLIFELLVFWFSCLRENQAFWTNAGGYPVGLRETVLAFYYPLLFVNAALLILLSLVFAARIRRPWRLVGLQAGVLLVCWGVFCGSLSVSWANNLLNFLEGRPVHYHKDRP